MLELIKMSRIEDGSELAAEVDALLNDAFPEGAPNERSAYYSRHGVPTTSMLLSDGGRTVGHLVIYERDIKIGEEALRVGLLGEIAITADRRGGGLARRLVRQAHEHLRARSIPFAILFAFEPRVYVSSGYKLMQNQTRFIDTDGHCKTLVYHGGMYAELLGRPWPNQSIDLCGTAV
jgi:predicted N-acetyltransferase YhbS